MPLVFPRYSTEQNCEVYHNHSECTESNNIEQRNFAFGVGGKRLCKHCEKLANCDAMAEKMKRDPLFIAQSILNKRTSSILSYIKEKEGK